MGEYATKNENEEGEVRWLASDGKSYKTRAGAWKHSKNLEAKANAPEVVEPKVEPVVEPEPEEEVVITEEPVVEKTNDFESMTKRQLEDFGRTIGIELDRRHSKKVLIKELEEKLNPTT